MYQFSNSLIRQFPSLVTGNSAVGVQATVYIGETGATASLFESNGTTPKANPVTTDSKGFYSFSLADGDYRIVFSSSQFATLRISVLDGAQIREDFDALVASNELFKDEQQAAYDSFVLSQGWEQVGTFAAGFTYTSPNQVGQDADGNWWRWNGALPKIVTAGTLPSSDANYKLVGDGVLRGDLNDGTALVNGKPASELGNIQGNESVTHFSIGCIPRCNDSGVFELLNDTVHNPMNVASVTQPDQYTIRINYSETAGKINTFIAAPDAELAPYGVFCGGDVGTALANIQAHTDLSFRADNNSPNPNIILNDLWDPSFTSGSITAVRLSASTLRVTHPPSITNNPPVVSVVSANRPMRYVLSFGDSLVDVICVGAAKGYISYSGSAWSQQFSDNLTAPTLTWTGTSIKVDHGISYNGSVVPNISAFGSGPTPRISNYGSTFFEVSFYDTSGTLVTTQASNMSFFYSLELDVPCNWPIGNTVNVHRGLCRVPSFNFKGVTGNNLWVIGTFEKP